MTLMIREEVATRSGALAAALDAEYSRGTNHE
jgi:hypothetical protein